ncbi:CPBP family intramembrane glutamic endopeptidase [Burkholderia sp. S-53]|uniref:CPBP family intramembrane glutamic endopeptidase n=1 Tax=Burkholderia sp. S-53 TaxID=2906514 RepID=UPI0021D0E06C|nr:CPBP family intramembrane glutamic endopeptidase [Burkholderia sp. S-53]UXU90782.1 CPBP family intramembrane metalloprotease [Burkholderia sp. S-53]
MLLIVAWIVGNIVYFPVELVVGNWLDLNAAAYFLQLAFLCSTTICLWFGMFFVAKFSLHRNIKTFIYSAEKINAKLLVFGVLIFVCARAIDFLVVLVAGGRVEAPVIRHPDFAVTPVFVGYSAIYVVVLVFQSAIEEVISRGFVMQSVFLFAKSRFVSAIITSAAFVLLHPGNDFVFSATMFAASMWMTALCLASDGLEMSIGFHIGNNVGAFFATVYLGGAYVNVTTPAGLEWSLFFVYAFFTAATLALAPQCRCRRRSRVLEK